MQNVQTPLGPSQSSKMRATGIIFYSTSSHRGYWLSPRRMEAFRLKFPTFRTFAGGPWFEEDCDAAAVALAFPECYGAQELRSAIASARWSAADGGARGWADIIRWLDGSQEGGVIRAKVAAWEREHAADWEIGGGATSEAGWSFRIRRIGDGAQRVAHFAEYPSASIFTDADLAGRIIGPAKETLAQA